MWWQLRILVGYHFQRFLSRIFANSMVFSSALKEINREYSENESWKRGKTMFFGSTILILLILILVSWIFS